ncbi:dUTP diphosphatase [Lederbergia galactosidilytica]|uniref:dUTPase n=1 Tax=Lederbergia galactosidilytica TaxID=217031 RepID=A0A177ZQF3_9BACI|nr:dUTP diphosphatase [Lederbergia galactosidilytica]OAK70075.1 hypothetical protein ABB05_12905 [Lederbergia galactosidilytica]
MNLNKLFTLQDKLDDHIKKEKGLEGQDLLDKKILALQVELGELANEWRGFKFWKVNPRPRTEDWIECSVCNGTGDLNYERVQEEAEGSGGHEYIDCEECDSSGTSHMINPLLEEYVDGLHFILSIGLDLKIDHTEIFVGQDFTVDRNITKTFTKLMCMPERFENAIGDDDYGFYIDWYEELLVCFIGLGEMLGFTWEEVEQAYMDKNTINYERQANNY